MRFKTCFISLALPGNPLARTLNYELPLFSDTLHVVTTVQGFLLYGFSVSLFLTMILLYPLHSHPQRFTAHFSCLPPTAVGFRGNFYIRFGTPHTYTQAVCEKMYIADAFTHTVRTYFCRLIFQRKILTHFHVGKPNVAHKKYR